MPHGMGTDRYHEPPEDLPAAVRTFARIRTSLVEEAEAIGWYSGPQAAFALGSG